MAQSVREGLTAMGAPAAAAHHIVKAVHHGGAFVIAQHPPAGINAAALTALVEQAFVSGWHLALIACAVVTLVFGFLIYALIPARKSAQTDPARA